MKYIFGLAGTADGRDTLTLELPPGSTVFEALRRARRFVTGMR